MPPRWLTPVPDEDVDRGIGRRVGQFIEAMCVTTKRTVSGPAGKPMRLMDWQWDLLGRLYAVRPDGRRRHRVALVGVPRKNGKSGLASGIAIYHLLMEDAGAEVYSCAADRLQAKIVFGEASKMIEASPELSAQCKVYRDAIEVPGTGSVYRALSSEAYTKEGLSPSAVLVDELHALPRRDLWDVMALAQGARVDPLQLAFTTAGVRTDVSGGDSICYQLYQYLQDIATGHVEDPSFYGEWWASDKPISDETGDADANPSIGVLLDPEDLDATRKRTPQTEYMTKRRNLFVATAKHWFPEGVFEGLADPTVEIGDRPVVLGFDGAKTQDCTAIIGCTADGDEHLFTVGVWARPRDAEAHWTVPTGEVLAKMREAFDTYNVREVVIDPAFWRERMEGFQAEGYPVVEFSQQSAGMVQATSGFQQAVIDEGLTHDGDPTLMLHVRNCHVELAKGGIKVQKASKMSTAKIDSAVAGIMARYRAVFYADRPEPVRGVFIG